jgi:hypothetical protein
MLDSRRRKLLRLQSALAVPFVGFLLLYGLPALAAHLIPSELWSSLMPLNRLIRAHLLPFLSAGHVVLSTTGNYFARASSEPLLLSIVQWTGLSVLNAVLSIRTTFFGPFGGAMLVIACAWVISFVAFQTLSLSVLPFRFGV